MAMASFDWKTNAIPKNYQLSWHGKRVGATPPLKGRSISIGNMSALMQRLFTATSQRPCYDSLEEGQEKAYGKWRPEVEVKGLANIGFKGLSCVGSRKSRASKTINNTKDKMICTYLHVYRESFQNRVLPLQLAVDSDSYVPLVKMCGITSVQDAVVAVEAGAKFIGMILWPKSKRSVPLNVAKEISKAAREHGAEPVGVFVEEDANVIRRVSDATDVGFVQLHGNGARSALPTLVQHHRIIYVLHVDKDGELLTKPPNEECSALVDWILVDSLQGGSGKKFDWDKFQVPSAASKYGWILAGGIDPENVGNAISILRPDVVDVSSGICKPDGVQKDSARIASFMNAVRGQK